MAAPGCSAGRRVGKDDPRIEAYGTVDELNSVLGWARAVGLPADVDDLHQRIQNELFAVGAELATPDPAAHGTDWIGADADRGARASDRPLRGTAGRR